MSSCVSCCHTKSRVRYSSGIVHFRGIGLSHHVSCMVSHPLYIPSFVERCGKAIIYPKERAHLHILFCFAKSLHSVGREFHYFTWSHIVLDVKTKIRESRRFGCGCHRTVLLAYDDRCTSPEVACGNDAVVCQYEHGAGPLHGLIDVFYSIYKVFPLYDK